MTIEDLDLLFVSENGFSKFLPMITENSYLKIEYYVNHFSQQYKTYYIDGVSGNYTIEKLILSGEYFNREVGKVSFLVTDVKIHYINCVLGLECEIGDIVTLIVTLIVYAVFNREAISHFKVQFPNNFPKEYSEVVCSDEKYHELIQTNIEQRCKKSPHTRNKKVTNYIVDVVNYSIRIPIDVKIITYTASLPTIPTIKLIGNDFKLFAFGEDKGKISEYVDESVIATLKSYGKTYTPAIKNKTVYRRMKKFYGE
jgi:hypothetical protein